MSNKYIPDIALTNGHVFRCTISGDKCPEIYGWIEKGHTIVKGTSGWYRTTDANLAARIAANNIGEEVA